MKDLFKNIKRRLLAHESEMDLDSVWASLEARRSNKVQKKSRFRLASVLMLLLWIGGCGTCIWVETIEKHVAQTTQQQTPPAIVPLPYIGQPTLRPVRRNRIPAYKDYSDHVENVVRNIPKQPIHDFLSAQSQSLSFSPNTTPSIASNGNAEGIIVVQPTDKAPIENNLTYLQTTQVVQVPPAHVTSASMEAASTPIQATEITPNLPPLLLLMLAQRDLGWLAPKPGNLNLTTRYNAKTPKKSAQQKATHATAVYAGGGYLSTQQQFSDREGQSAQGGAALRKQTEQALPSFTLHAGVQREIGKGRLLDFGVHYDQWYDHLDYTYNKPHTYQYDNVLLGVRRLAATGSEVVTYGNIAVNGTQKVQALYYNRYASINLRLTLMQSIYHKERWDIALGTGVNANLWTQADGLVSAPDPVQGTYELDKIYKNAFGVGITASSRLTYRFNEHYALQLTPSATWGLSNVLNTTSPLQSRLRQYSATAGLLYKF